MMTTRRSFLLSGAALGAMSVAGFGFAAYAGGADASTLRIAVGKEPGNLNPQQYKGMFAVQAMIFEPLVSYGEGGRIEPALAESWTVSDDGKILTFKLRQGVTFTDGTPWNSEAAIWNLNRWIGVEDHNWLGIVAGFESTEIIDNATIAIHLKKVVPAALTELSYVRPVRFLSPKSVGADGAYEKPVGTGPWVFASGGADAVELTRNDSYWGKKPSMEKVSLAVMTNARGRVDALRAGQIDVTGGTLVAQLSPDDATTLKDSGMNVVAAPGTDTMILGFNPTRPIFQDAALREAINLCIDRDAICQKVTLGFATPTMNLFPQTVANSGTRYPVPARDVEKAKALLDKAGWVGTDTRQKDGQPLAIEMVISPEEVAGSRALAEVLQAYLKEIGIDMTIRVVDHTSKHDDIPKMKYDVALFITAGAPYDPFSSLPLYFLSTFLTGTDGKLWLDKDVLDPLIDKALYANEADRAANYQAFFDWLYDNNVMAPIYHASRIWAFGPRVQNFSVPSTEYQLPYAGISVVDAG
jgi:nickel transport system substrate-binding protein